MPTRGPAAAAAAPPPVATPPTICGRARAAASAQLAVDDVQVGPTDRAGEDAHEHGAGAQASGREARPSGRPFSGRRAPQRARMPPVSTLVHSATLAEIEYRRLEPSELKPTVFDLRHGSRSVRSVRLAACARWCWTPRERLRAASQPEGHPGARPRLRGVGPRACMSSTASRSSARLGHQVVGEVDGEGHVSELGSDLRQNAGSPLQP